MATGLYIDARQLQKGVKGFERLIKEMPDKVSDVLNASALEIEDKAKRAAPADRGASGLRGSISADINKPLTKRITAGAPYAAYVEFGTGRYAAQEVSRLPPDYKTYAARFRTGSGKRSVKGMLFILMGWFGRVGIKDKQKQYHIAKNIVINGTHPHPFMIPAIISQIPILKRNMQTLLSKLKF